MNAVIKYVVLQDLMVSVSFGTSDGSMLNEAQLQAVMKVLQTQPITRYLSANIGKINASSIQRKEAAETLKTRRIRTAVVTDDTLVRGLVTAISWLGANTSAFAWVDTKAALSYLDVTDAFAERALEALTKLRIETEVDVRKR